MIPKRNLEMLLPLTGITSCLELGNKREGAKPPYKSYFEARGIRHVSVDLNGRDGALPLDLRDPLNLGTFDLVTNYGTTEHVSEQEPVWRNIADACDVLFVSVTPSAGEYRGHGMWQPTIGFYVAFAELNGFKIERIAQRERSAGRTNTHVRMRRHKRVPFVMPDHGLLYHEADRDKYSKVIPPRA
jgi:hypothetical protein